MAEVNAIGFPVIDDDTMATAAATNICTSESIKAYVDNTVGGVAANQTQMEAASSTAVYSAPGNQQWHPGHPKGWVEYNQVSNTVLASYNVTSVTDTSTGDFTVNWDVDFSSANYTASMSTIATGGGINPIHIGVFTTGGAASIASGSIRCVVKSDVTPVDVEFNSVVAYGDQA